jgi:hypothetical protein
MQECQPLKEVVLMLHSLCGQRSEIFHELIPVPWKYHGKKETEMEAVRKRKSRDKGSERNREREKITRRHG